MEFRILGPLEVLSDGRVLELGGHKQRALLALLLIDANRVVSTDRLIDALWGDDPPGTGQKTLQAYVSRLRKVLGSGRLQTRAPGYALRVEPDELDLMRFESLQAEEKLQEGLALWRGSPLGEFASERFAQAEIARLDELHLACLEERVEQDLTAGRHADLVGELEARVREHPLRERLRAQLMLALYRSSRQAEALEAYQAARTALVDELGIEPTRDLRQLHQRILGQDPALDLPPDVEREVEPASGTFVGRDAELAELLDGLESVFAPAGSGQLFLLVGEPGIGKSRLAEELVSRARARGARILVGRCWEAGGAPAYWPWVQSLRGLTRDIEPDLLRAQLAVGAAEIAQILPELREILPGLPEPVESDPEGARFRLFHAVTQFLRNAAVDQPIVLVLDDLHAADTPSLLLMQFLARELGSTRVLVVGALRDVDPLPAQALTAMLAEIAREPVTHRVSLGGLSEREVADYIEVTAADIASPELTAALHDETEGNPLFITETVRLLVTEGVPRDWAGGPELAIPQSLRDVIGQRLAHLSDDCNRVLLLASVLGREFVLAALARVAGVSEDELLEILDEAMTARVVSDVPGGHNRLRFGHVLIRDALYDGLTTARRVRLHRQAVEALEALYGDEPGPHLAELVHHSIAGSDFGKALLYARRAGDRAIALLAYEEGARLYETTLEVLDVSQAPDEQVRCELLLSLGDAEARAGDRLAAKQAFLEAAKIARRLGLSRQLARAASGYGGRIMIARAGDDGRLVPLLEEGLAALADEDIELRVRLLARLAGALRDEPSRDRRDALSREAVELARRTGNPAALVYALTGRPSVIAAPDTVEECRALADELREVAERVGDAERMLQGYIDGFIARAILGDVSGQAAVLAAASRIACELRQPTHAWQVSATQAMLALTSGSFATAEELILEAFTLGERAQPEMAIPIHRLQHYMLSDFLDQLEAVEPSIHDLVAEYPARSVFRCVLCHLHARLGRLPEAKRALDDLAADDFSALPFDQEWLYGMSLLAETCALLDESDATPVVYRLLLPWGALNSVDHPEGFRGSVSRYLGLLATMMKRWEDAILHFEVALEMNERMGARPWLAHTQHDYARMLLERSEPGDDERTREFLARALATYRELGMESYEKATSALALEFDARARS